MQDVRKLEAGTDHSLGFLWEATDTEPHTENPARSRINLRECVCWLLLRCRSPLPTAPTHHARLALIQLPRHKNVVLHFSAPENAVSHFEVRQGHSLLILLERSVLIHRDGLRDSIRASDLNLGSVDGLNFPHDEVLAHPFAKIPHHALGRDCDHFRLDNTVSSLFAAHEHIVPDLQVGEFRILPLLAKARLIGDVDLNGAAVHGLYGEGVPANGGEASGNSGSAAPLALTLSGLTRRGGVVRPLRPSCGTNHQQDCYQNQLLHGYSFDGLRSFKHRPTEIVVKRQSTWVKNCKTGSFECPIRSLP